MKGDRVFDVTPYEGAARENRQGKPFSLNLPAGYLTTLDADGVLRVTGGEGEVAAYSGIHSYRQRVVVFDSRQGDTMDRPEPAP